VIGSELASATAALAHDMVMLEQRAREAELAGRDDRAQRVWAERDDVRHERSLLMRRQWMLRAEWWWMR
jgi:hypothetical protein